MCSAHPDTTVRGGPYSRREMQIIWTALVQRNTSEVLYALSKL